jgi:glc operon protein GlcG
MVVIRIGPRGLAFLGMALTPVVGLVVGSLRPVDHVAAAARATTPVDDVLPAPLAQAGPRITAEQAARMIAGAIEYARANNLQQSFVVLDAGGHVIASMRMDGAALFTIEFALGKAYLSAVAGRPSAALGESYQNNPAPWGNAAGIGYGVPMLPSRGAWPVTMNGVLVGSIGASGAPSQEDENAVRAGLAAVGLQ